MLSRLDGGHDKRFSRFNSADQLDNDIDIRIAYQLVCVPGQRDIFELFGQFGGIMIGDTGQPDDHPGPFYKSFPLREQHFCHSFAYRSKSNQTNLDFSHHRDPFK